MISRFIIILIIGYYSLLLKLPKAFAVGLEDFKDEVFRPENLPSGKLGNDTADTKIIDIINFFVDLILYASGSIAVFMLIVGGIKVIFSFGEASKAAEGKKLIQYALTGLLAVILAYALVTNVMNLIFKATS